MAACEVKTFDLGTGVSLEMVWCPPGEFMMGFSDSDEDAYYSDKPQHKVTFRTGFWMGKYPVTQAQWQAIMSGNPSHFSDEPDSPQRPVEQVNCEGVKKFCQKLKRKTGENFRLPSEAEWEYACRAGSTTDYCFGDDKGQLELYGNSAETPIYGGESTSPVGTFRPNAWGLYDMHGNVAEWCEDKWHRNYDGAPADGSPWLCSPWPYMGGDCRAVRGGGWCRADWVCSAACRGRARSLERWRDLGFRLALSPAVH